MPKLSSSVGEMIVLAGM